MVSPLLGKDVAPPQVLKTLQGPAIFIREFDEE